MCFGSQQEVLVYFDSQEDTVMCFGSKKWHFIMYILYIGSQEDT